MAHLLKAVGLRIDWFLLEWRRAAFRKKRNTYCPPGQLASAWHFDGS